MLQIVCAAGIGCCPRIRHQWPLLRLQKRRGDMLAVLTDRARAGTDRDEPIVRAAPDFDRSLVKIAPGAAHGRRNHVFVAYNRANPALALIGLTLLKGALADKLDDFEIGDDHGPGTSRRISTLQHGRSPRSALTAQ
jgi:hypothetical protein